jgi:hypothetical protein
VKVDYAIIAAAIFVFTLSIISAFTIMDNADPALRLQLFVPLISLLATGVALVVMLGVIYASKKAIAPAS